MEEIKQPYDKLLNFIDRIGPIEKIANNSEIIKIIMSYDTDRHLLCAFFDRINEALESGKLLPEVLTYFRTGEIMDDIIHLEEIIKKYGHDKTRNLYNSEILDKINYVSLIKDEQSLSACYTHPDIIDAICGKMVKNVNQLRWWTTSGTFTTLPPKVQMRIITSVLEAGGIEESKKMLIDASYKMPTSQVNKENNKSFNI